MLNDGIQTGKKLINIPKYTLGEELINAISHGIGAGLGIAALVLCIVRSAMHHNAYAVVSSAIYGTSLIILYIISTLYHSFRPTRKVKKVFRILDNCSIFLLIFGTYTPVALVTLNGVIGWIIFSVILACAILGIVLNSVNLEKYKKFSMICYIIMGWMIVIAFKPMCKMLDPRGIMLLVLGGIIYTIGAIIYGVGKKVKYMHSIWHFFVVAGSILHFFVIYLYVI